MRLIWIPCESRRRCEGLGLWMRRGGMVVSVLGGGSWVIIGTEGGSP